MTTVVIMVIRIEQYLRGMKCGIAIEYLKCRATLNFEVDFDAMARLGPSGILLYSDSYGFSRKTFMLKIPLDPPPPPPPPKVKRYEMTRDKWVVDVM